MPLFNPDPNYRDPDFEKRLVPEQGSVEALDVLNAAPPGHSLTDAPGEAAWERPAIYSKPEDALSFVIEKVQDSDAEENFLRLMISGTPIEAIINTIIFAGFSEGYWTPDVGEMMKLPLALHFIGLAVENNISATAFNIAPEDKRMQGQISDADTLHMMGERRPDILNDLTYAADLINRPAQEPAQELTEEMPLQPVAEEEGSFLTAEEEI